MVDEEEQSVDIFPTHFFARTSCTRIASSDDVVTNKNTSFSSSSFSFSSSPSRSKSNQLSTNVALANRFWCPVLICPNIALVSASTSAMLFFAQYASTLTPSSSSASFASSSSFTRPTYAPFTTPTVACVLEYQFGDGSDTIPDSKLTTTPFFCVFSSFFAFWEARGREGDSSSSSSSFASDESSVVGRPILFFFSSSSSLCRIWPSPPPLPPRRVECSFRFYMNKTILTVIKERPNYIHVSSLLFFCIV